MPSSTKKSFQYGAQTVTLETGEIARQAHGAVLVNMDDTVVLATVVAAKEAKDLLRWAYSRRLFQPGGASLRKRDPHLPPDRPTDPPAVSGWVL